jgi:hypothetical protein
MPVKTKVEPVVGNPNLASEKDWPGFGGQPLVDVRLPLQEPDENNVKPSQIFKYTINSVDYTIERGRNKKIPRDHFLVLRVGMPNL